MLEAKDRWLRQPLSANLNFVSNGGNVVNLTWMLTGESVSGDEGPAVSALSLSAEARHVYRCLLTVAGRDLGTPLPADVFPSLEEAREALDATEVTDYVIQHLAYPAVRDFVVQRLEDQPYAIELEVVVLGSRSLLQLSLVVDWMGKNVTLPWFLTNMIPIGMGALDAARVLEDLLPGVLQSAGLAGHTQSLAYVASRLHQREWRVYQRGRGGSLSCVLQRGMPAPGDLCLRGYSEVVAFLEELSGVRETFPFLGLLMGDILRPLPADSASPQYWASVLQFARALVQGQHGLVTRCNQAGLLESGALVARLVDPTSTFWMVEFVHTFHPLEVLCHQLHEARSFDAVMSVVLEFLTALGLRLVGPSFPRYKLLDVATTLYNAAGRVVVPAGRGTDFHQRPVPQLVPSVTRAVALTVFPRPDGAAVHHSCGVLPPPVSERAGSASPRRVPAAWRSVGR